MFTALSARRFFESFADYFRFILDCEAFAKNQKHFAQAHKSRDNEQF